MKIKRFLITCVALLLVSGGFLSAEEVIGESIAESIETPHPYSQLMNGEQAWVETIHYSGAGWIKPHFSQFRLNPEDYIEIIDRNGVVVETIKGSDVAANDVSRFNVERQGRHDKKGAGFWGPMVDGDEVTFILYSKSNGPDNWGFKIDEVGIGYSDSFVSPRPELSTVESTCGGSDDKVNIECISGTKYNNSKSVGRMHYKKGSSWYVCTGSLVSCNGGSQFLTNQHCIDSQAIVDTLDVRFNYQYTTCNGATVATYATYYGDQYIKSSSSLDYCVLTLKNNPQNVYGTLDISDRTVTVGENIYIIQHPGGGVKKYSTSPTLDASYADQYSDPNVELLYFADTEGGSSGSPVFATSDNKVVALHHTGYCPNEGVKMSLIYPQIKTDIGCSTGGNTITVTFPNGGETFAGGSTQTITWTSTGTISNVKIEYTKNNGKKWLTIASSTANDGSYQWTLPTPNRTKRKCKVRISEVGGSAIDTSNANFKILK